MKQPNSPNKRHPAPRTFREMLQHSDHRKQEIKNGIPSRQSNELAFLYWDIANFHSFDARKMEIAMSSYYRRKFGMDVQRINQEKTNLQRALSKNKITWDRLKTVIELMGPAWFQLSIKLGYKNGNVYDHSIKINLTTPTRAGTDDDKTDE